MDWVDGLIVIFVLAAIVRGIDSGFVRQLGSTGGFLGGLILGAWLQGKFIHHMHTANSRTMFSLCITIGMGLLLLTIGEFTANRIKLRLELSKIDKLDRTLGSIVAVIAVLVTVWLGASGFSNGQFGALQRHIKDSKIISYLDRTLPAAPQVITKMGRLISPNGFPQVFSGLEPNPTRTPVEIPDMGELAGAVKKDTASIVKIEGTGCGGVVEGSGFVAANGIVITNAHVVAGVKYPKVLDANGVHRTTVIAFDPDLDLAILRTSDLAGPPLPLSADIASPGTFAAVVGYPGGGDFTASPAAIIDSYEATGRNIYDESVVSRQIYSIDADVIPGNSGGPIINAQGTVIGIVFAESLTYDHIGYALAMQRVIDGLTIAQQNTQPVGTGSCAK